MATKKRGWMAHQIVSMTVHNPRGIAPALRHASTPSPLLADLLAAAGRAADATTYLGGVTKLAAVLFGPDPRAEAQDDLGDLVKNGVRLGPDDQWVEAGTSGVIIVIHESRADSPYSMGVFTTDVKRAAVVLCPVRLPAPISVAEAMHPDVGWEPDFDPSVLPPGSAFTFIKGAWKAR